MVKRELMRRKEKIDLRDSTDQSDGKKTMKKSRLGKELDRQYFTTTKRKLRDFERFIAIFGDHG